MDIPVRNISATLDTTCIIDLHQVEHPEFRQAMAKLIKLARSQELDLSVTTRVESQATREPTINEYRNLVDNGTIQVVPSTTRLDYWKLGTDVLPDERLWKSIAQAVFPSRDPEILFRQPGKKVRDAVDIDHLYGHLLAKRDYFITRDEDILQAREELATLGIQVRKPAELIEEIFRRT